MLACAVVDTQVGALACAEVQTLKFPQNECSRPKIKLTSSNQINQISLAAADLNSALWPKELLKINCEGIECLPSLILSLMFNFQIGSYIGNLTHAFC